MELIEVREVLDSGALVCDVDVPAAALGMSKWAYYEAVKRGDAPVMPIMVGRRQKYRVSDIRQLLGIVGDTREAADKALVASDGQ